MVKYLLGEAGRNITDIVLTVDPCGPPRFREGADPRGA